jgi:predicted porin
MNKKFLIAAIGAALAAGPMLASAADVKLGGRLHVSLDRLDRDEGAEPQEQGFVSSNSSRFTLTVSEDLGGGMKAVGFVDTPFDITESGGTFAGRNAFAGLQGGFGRVIVGRNDTPYKMLGLRVNDFPEQVGDTRNVLSIGGTTTANAWDLRPNDIIQYDSPKLGGVVVSAQYSANETGYGHATSMSVVYTGGPLLVGGAYEKHNSTVNDGGGDDEAGIRVVVTYDFGGPQVGAIVQQTKDMGGVAGADRQTIGAKFSMPFGNTKLKVAYMKADDIDNTSNTDGSQLSLGVDHSFTKTTMVYLNYAKADNGDNVRNFNVVSAAAGHGESYPATVNGASPSGISAGLRIDF